MSDTQRTRAQILALFADNTSGDISPQDLRDFVVTVMEADFAYAGDFWTQPKPDNLTTDKTIKGWIDYSQIMVSAVSFGKIVRMTASGWKCAGASAAADHVGVLGIAGNSYIAGETQAQVLRRGLVFDTALGLRFSGYVGSPVYLVSQATGSLAASYVGPSVVVLGYVERSTITDVSVTSSKWRFEPTWGVTTM